MNRLAKATSPYLRQHRENPVDWFPWGEEAFAKAGDEDKPIFLSVGYSSCHWCHVMAHESFESPEVAAVLNESFVSVKVDREERPDVDEAYMTAVQLSSGRGGWPMSVFLTPEKKPFFAGTYFPLRDRQGYPGFLSICRQIAELWRHRRDEVEANASEFASSLLGALGRAAPASSARFDQELVDRAVQALWADFDPVNGGFGAAPKFPPHTAVDFLLRYAASETPRSVELTERARNMALFSLEKMCLGGIHDHVGGGFHRYSTDGEWRLPHFEKMLYDNALMLANLRRAVSMVRDESQEDTFAPALSGILRWLRNEMTSSDGTFFSALDADSEGEEGAFYVWTAHQLEAVLGSGDAAFSVAFNVQCEGNFADEATHRLTGKNVLVRTGPGGASFHAELETLRRARESRPKPMLDHKVIVSWNGLAIAALASTFSPETERAAQAILEAEAKLGWLPHQIVDGEPSGQGFLEDYAAFALGLFALADMRDGLESAVDVPAALRPTLDTPAARTAAAWRSDAMRLTREMIEGFWDPQGGGFSSSSASHEMLFGRPKPVFDQPVPSGNALALRCLIEAGDLERANRLVAGLLGWIERAPEATASLLSAALPLLSPRTGVVVAEPRVEVRLESAEVKADAAGEYRIDVLISVPAGWHLSDNEPGESSPAPTRIEIHGLEGNAEFPPANGGRYEGDLKVPVFVRLPEGAAREEFEIVVTFQACTTTICALPERRTLACRIAR